MRVLGSKIGLVLLLAVYASPARPDALSYRFDTKIVRLSLFDLAWLEGRFFPVRLSGVRNIDLSKTTDLVPIVAECKSRTRHRFFWVRCQAEGYGDVANYLINNELADPICDHGYGTDRQCGRSYSSALDNYLKSKSSNGQP